MNLNKANLGDDVHFDSSCRLYRIWGGMKTRCNNPNDHSYVHYGARGIKVCEEWNDFINFYKWSIKNGYEDDLSIDRIDSLGDYEPSNCRWTDIKTQNRNRRTTIPVTINGETKVLSKWAEESGISYSALIQRYNRGERGEKLLRPLKSSRPSNNKSGYKGVSYSNYKVKNKWKSTFSMGYKTKFLGYYSTAAEAGRAYRKFFVEYYRNIKKLKGCTLQQLLYLARNEIVYKYEVLFELDRRLHDE